VRACATLITGAPPPALFLGRDVKDTHVSDVAQDAAQDLAFGCTGGVRPPRDATTTAAAVFAQLGYATMRGQLAAQWNFARTLGRRFRGCRAFRFSS